jgi:hypothetical protein
MKSKFGKRSLFLFLRILLGILVVGTTATQLLLEPSSAEPELVLAQAPPNETCAGDETITFAPPEPAAGEEILVAVTSARQHAGVWLHAPDRPRQYREYPGGLGWIWDWRLTPARPGERAIAFFAESTTLCAVATLVVGPASLAASATPVPGGSKRSSNSNDNNDNEENGNDGGGNGNDNSDRRETATATPTGTRTATPTSTRVPAPSIRDVEPAAVCRGDTLTIEGRRFGSSRGLVDGEVIVAGAPVRDYLRWSSNEIVVVVPNGAAEEQDQEVFVVTAGGFDQASVSVFSSC